jgi:hypothetical protein
MHAPIHARHVWIQIPYIRSHSTVLHVSMCSACASYAELEAILKTAPRFHGLKVRNDIFIVIK